MVWDGGTMPPAPPHASAAAHDAREGRESPRRYWRKAHTESWALRVSWARCAGVVGCVRGVG